MYHFRSTQAYISYCYFCSIDTLRLRHPPRPKGRGFLERCYNTYMKIIIIYDSQFGNTKKVAQAIASALKNPHKVTIKHINESQISELTNVDLLIVGSPTQGGRPTENLLKFLEQIPANGLNNVKVAAFDTRFRENNQKFLLRLLLKTLGYAAPRIAVILEKKGGKLTAPPEGFIVLGKRGPLAKGELERAKTWGMRFTSSPIKY